MVLRKMRLLLFRAERSNYAHYIRAIFRKCAASVSTSKFLSERASNEKFVSYSNASPTFI